MEIRSAIHIEDLIKSGTRTFRELLSNVQRIAVKTAGGSKKMHVCTRCMRSGKVERA